MKKWSKNLIVLVGFLASMSFGTALAEFQYNDYRIGGDIELGWRFFLERPSERERGKFEEYRDIPPGIFLENLEMYLLSKDESYLIEIRARDVGLEDQNFFLRSSKVGLYSFEFEWDQVPHVFSTASPLADKIDLRRDTARLSLSYTPTPEWDVWADYKYTDRDGLIPKGVISEVLHPGQQPTGSTGFGAFDFEGFLQPVQYTDHDMSLNAGLARKDYQLQLSYGLSLFENDIPSIHADSAPVTAANRIALPPDNMAHVITASGGINLPYRTRVNSSFSYSAHLQSEDLLPSLNPVTQPGQNFDGQVNTFMYYLSAVSRPATPLTLKAMYRLYHYDDESDVLTSTLSGFPNTSAERSWFSQRFPFTRHNASLEGKWQFKWPLSLNVGYNWEHYDRNKDVLQVGSTDDHTPKISIDYTPFDWLLLGTAYSHSIRSISDLNAGPNTLSNVSPQPPGPPHPQRFDCGSCHAFGTGVNVNPVANKFNMADRDRDQIDVFTEITPLDNVTASANFSYANDDYSNSLTGLLKDENWSAGLNVTWRPMKRISLYTSFVHEEFKSKQRINDLVDIDPEQVLNTDDDVDTIGIGTNVILLPEKLDWDVRWNYTLAESNLHNPNLPKLESTFSQYQTYLRYRFYKNWTAKVGYIFEDFNISNAYAHDVQVEGNAIPGDEFYRPYTAHIVALSLNYRF